MLSVRQSDQLLVSMGQVHTTEDPTQCLSPSKIFTKLPCRGAKCCTRWLGQNSKQNKLNRQLGDVQTHMRLKVSGDKSEIRQSYIPALYPSIVQPLIDEGSVSPRSCLQPVRYQPVHSQNAIEDIIQTMDEYYLSREDWDTIVELGVDHRKDELVLKKIPAAAKSAFTRKYVYPQF
jgi:replication factor C subunit 1